MQNGIEIQGIQPDLINNKPSEVNTAAIEITDETSNATNEALANSSDTDYQEPKPNAYVESYFGE